MGSVQALSPVRLSDPMDCSTPGLRVHHQLLELASTHVHRVSDAIQPSHPLSAPSFPVSAYEREVAQSCQTLCDPVDCSPPSSSVHGILQARILECIAISFSRSSSQPRDGTWVSCIAGSFFTPEPPGKCLHWRHRILTI